MDTFFCSVRFSLTFHLYTQNDMFAMTTTSEMNIFCMTTTTLLARATSSYALIASSRPYSVVWDALKNACQVRPGGYRQYVLPIDIWVGLHAVSPESSRAGMWPKAVQQTRLNESIR